MASIAGVDSISGKFSNVAGRVSGSLKARNAKSALLRGRGAGRSAKVVSIPAA